MLRADSNVSWEDHVTNVDLCGYLPRLSDTLRRRRMQFASHCVTHPELTASEMILCEPRKEVLRPTPDDGYQHSEEGLGTEQHHRDKNDHNGQGTVKGSNPELPCWLDTAACSSLYC